MGCLKIRGYLDSGRCDKRREACLEGITGSRRFQAVTKYIWKKGREKGLGEDGLAQMQEQYKEFVRDLLDVWFEETLRGELEIQRNLILCLANPPVLCYPETSKEGGLSMEHGQYVNPGNGGFQVILNSEYIDKTGLIGQMNSRIGSSEGLVCVSRPRRFGKSYAAKMLCAYHLYHR